MAVSGEKRWPRMGRNRWPLTFTGSKVSLWRRRRFPTIWRRTGTARSQSRFASTREKATGCGGRHCSSRPSSISTASTRTAHVPGAKGSSPIAVAMVAARRGSCWRSGRALAARAALRRLGLPRFAIGAPSSVGHVVGMVPPTTAESGKPQALRAASTPRALVVARGSIRQGALLLQGYLTIAFVAAAEAGGQVLWREAVA
jgi:hypothetical protein